MADLTLTNNMTQCLAETGSAANQTAGRAAFDAAAAGTVTTNTADIATNVTDIATNVTNIATNTADVAAIEADILARLIDWKGEWVPGTSALENEQFKDGEWLAVANAATTDRPAPQTSGDATYDLVDAPVWTTPTNTGQIDCYHIYTFAKPGWFRKVQVWIPDSDATITYGVAIIEDSNGTSQVIRHVTITNPIAGTWNTVDVGFVVVAVANEVSVVLQSLKSASTSDTGAWDYAGASDAGAPATGDWNHRKEQNVLRISDTDGAPTDRDADLDAITPGSTIKLADSVDATKYYQYLVASNTDSGTYHTFDVTLIATGTGGGPTSALESLISVVVAVPASTEYVAIADYWDSSEPNWATVVSRLDLTGATDADVNDAYGIRLLFQPAYISADWDLQASLGDSKSLSQVEVLELADTVLSTPTAVTTVNAATYDLLTADKVVHVTYTTTGAAAITLPTAQAVSGRTITIKDGGGNASVNNITIDTEGSETIDGATTLIILVDYTSVTLYSDGTNWFIS
tara:strand:- start:344 stop:1897 length:1554 start_codon:yes stop_codon:yes gene_type:complete